MARGVKILLGLLVVLLAYLLLWPVPVAPVAWRAPTFDGYRGPHAVNHRLAAARQVSMKRPLSCTARISACGIDHSRQPAGKRPWSAAT